MCARLLWNLVVFSCIGFIASAPASAQEVDGSSVRWFLVGVDRFSPSCVSGSGASLEIAGNSLIYTFTPAEEPNNPWRVRFTWEDPVMGEPPLTTITGRVDGVVEREGSPAGPTPGVRMYMITVPTAYTVKWANSEFSASLGEGGSVGDNFEANANPDWTEPFDVLVWFSALLCDLGNREVARYHFQRLSEGEIIGEAEQRTNQLVCDAVAQVHERFLSLRQEAATRLQDSLERIQQVEERIQQVRKNPSRFDANEVAILVTQRQVLLLEAARAQIELETAQRGLSEQVNIMTEQACPNTPAQEPLMDVPEALVNDFSGLDSGIALLCDVTRQEVADLEARVEVIDRQLNSLNSQLTSNEVLINEFQPVIDEAQARGETPPEGYVQTVEQYEQMARDIRRQIRSLLEERDVLLRRIGDRTLTMEDFGCESES
jgi:hypothetical protein